MREYKKLFNGLLLINVLMMELKDFQKIGLMINQGRAIGGNIPVIWG